MGGSRMDVIARVPSESLVGEVLVPPALLAVVVGFALAWIVTRVLNRFRLSRYFWCPSVAFLALWALFFGVCALWVFVT
jgi:hypothetical protein